MTMTMTITERLDAVVVDPASLKIGDKFICVHHEFGEDTAKTFTVSDTNGRWVGFDIGHLNWTDRSFTIPIAHCHRKLIPLRLLTEESVFKFKLSGNIEDIRFKELT